ncbi:zinc finger FYVE domain-containing protein 9 isoform X1 [Salmo trutta]|uniref:zinc finger FYVE domain-containing protein 9 isoform X1 n=1 Tax=Salmo trutta TaxID=8032 RepID=UPI001131BEFB|nr:zinc finger FYVE domain-containing protein 9-like isoform X1 [Salmo trutta]XP_029561902.1 zinc finger FYVE domain-containing protein 9-like isoform X1 [Salmo trutta]XP_029561903.1 zinc finger FYVE domain-containing protein 9-like isoform X1 [Salmo trutta]XP_029561904.1 zinc finger FYVE domain-containing protein 9-like isoform X1 [Salmo trutta]XP_029561905.1 zinc finger FYVE domain-containing protein 9-like isoform X1 [Salmo trutta]XP_029561906.1 zinc finger FYVE domain-containing protein 9-
MENYFQAEAFNLDKVLDDFEQNQDDETDSPTLSDAKWSQILAPPTHFLSLNPALALTPDPRDGDCPLPFKTLQAPDPSSRHFQGPDSKRHPTAKPSSWGEERPGRTADVHSPPLPQPNIGKLVGGEEGSSPPVPASSSPPPYHHLALENGFTSISSSCPASPALNGLSEEPCKGNHTGVTPSNQQPSAPSEPRPDAPVEGREGERSGGSSHVSHSHFIYEERLGGDRRVADRQVAVEESNPRLEPESAWTGSPIQERDREEADMAGGQSQDTGERGQNGGWREGRPGEDSGGNVQNGGLMEELRGRRKKEKSLNGELEKSRGQNGEMALTNGLATAREEEEEEEEERGSLTPPPSKEDSVTEEKEMEESKQENEGGGERGGSSLPKKLNNSRLQPVSLPFGGARPKQPVGLKLQIPRPLYEQVQNHLAPSADTACSNTGGGKNKNLENRGGAVIMDTATVVALGDPGGGGGVVKGELLTEASSSSSSGLVEVSENSPDNDFQAGQHHQGALPRKQLSSLGDVAPVWVPDSQAPVCMKCEVRFTFTKRRHHCRACGKVFCAACCSLRSRLIYMDRKEARVCITCHSALLSARSREGMCDGSNQSPNPNNPAEYCSTIPPLQQVQASGALASLPPTVMVPVGVPKTPSSEGSLAREQRRVCFADGILPNGEAAESPKPPATSPAPSRPLAVSQCSNKSSTADSSEALSSAPAAPVGSPVGSSISLIPEDGLPPILISTGVKGGTGGHSTDYAVEERPSEIVLMQQLEEGGPDPLVFVLNANLLAMVKLVNYVNRKCWYVTSKGMHAVGQAEVVVLLQCLPDEKSIPKDLFSHFVQLYQEALTGNVLTHLGHSFFTQSFLGSREHGGFLYVTPSFQSLQDLMLPNPPYLFGVLLQKWETPWAKVFPIRLMFRLGAEYRFYPCPLFSVRFRKPLFGETGHTIMNLLADFRNYQYTLSMVKGLVVDMEVKKTCIKIPSNRYNELMKAMNKSDEHVLAMGACFNERADSHLVCVQNDDGNYQTQAISIHHQPRKVTGACFFVFSGSLKAGHLAKTSIVEDGVMVQITGETMDALRQALRDMKDFSITCGLVDQEDGQEHVHIQWIEDDLNFNKGVISPIDGKSMESITSVKIFQGSEFKANGKVIRWTEVFYLQSDDQAQPNGLSDPADHSRLTENVARAFCVALCPHLKLLKEDGMAKLSLRVTLDSEQVGYLAGSNGQPLLPHYLSDLDSTLIPVIHSGACQLSEGPVIMELVFYILEIIS